jgi:two-component system response regulator HydG
VRGAFTGACFLDEIGDISPHMQAKLLRVLQEHEIRRVGGKDWTKVDVRVIAATNQDLAELVKRRRFRHDLYYRLNVITLRLPPLRERVEDIPALAHYFLRRYSREQGKAVTGIATEAMDLLRAYPWPGNIRELENTLERAVAFARQPILDSGRIASGGARRSGAELVMRSRPGRRLMVRGDAHT